MIHNHQQASMGCYGNRRQVESDNITPYCSTVTGFTAQNGCCERHLTRDSTLTFEPTFDGQVIAKVRSKLKGEL